MTRSISVETLAEIVFVLLSLPYTHVNNKSYVEYHEVVTRANQAKSALRKLRPDLYKKVMMDLADKQVTNVDSAQ